MKKYILIMIIIFGMPSWAVCPIGESVCTLPDSGMPIFQIQNNSDPGLNKKNNSPQNTLKPSGMGSSLNRTQNHDGIKMQGSLGCQFGNCNKTPGNDLLPNR